MTTCCWKFWKFCLNLNRTRLHKIRRLRARNNYMKVCTTKICHLFLRVEKETLNSSKNTTHFLIFVFHLQSMLKSQQKVDIKLSKRCQSHQKLTEWQKVVSCFTEIVYKSSSEDSRKCWRRFKLFVDLLDSLKQGTTGNWILMTQMLAPANRAWVSGFAGFAGVVEITRLNTSEFYYLDELYGSELVFVLSFVSSNSSHWRRNYRAVYPNAHKVCLWFFWFRQCLPETLLTRRKHFLSYFVF